jgi:hypothetical protein
VADDTQLETLVERINEMDARIGQMEAEIKQLKLQRQSGGTGYSARIAKEEDPPRPTTGVATTKSPKTETDYGNLVDKPSPTPLELHKRGKT